MPKQYRLFTFTIQLLFSHVSLASCHFVDMLVSSETCELKGMAQSFESTDFAIILMLGVPFDVYVRSLLYSARIYNQHFDFIEFASCGGYNRKEVLTLFDQP